MLRDRNLLRVVAARFVSETGAVAGFFLGVWGKAAYDLDAGPTELALLMATLGLSGIVGSIMAGVLADRHGPKTVVVASEAVFVPATLLLIVASSLPALTLLVVPWMFAGAAIITAVTALPPFLTTDDGDLERVNAWVEGAGTAAFITGPVLGAAIVSAGGVTWVFVADAVTSVVAVSLLVGLRLRRVEPVDHGHGSLHDLREGLAFSYRDGRVRLVLAVASISYLVFGMFGALEPLFFRDVLGVGVEMIGYANAVFGVGLLAGTVLYARYGRRLTTARNAGVVTVASGFGAVLYTATRALPVVFVGAIVWGTVLGVLLPLVRTLAHRAAPERLVGRVMGTLQVHGQAGDLVPLLFAPALAVALGVQAALVAAGLAAAVLGAAMLPGLGRLDHAASGGDGSPAGPPSPTGPAVAPTGQVVAVPGDASG
jgi:MFS family permease